MAVNSMGGFRGSAIFVAANPVEAEIVRDYLASNGIEAEIRGQFAWGAVGEVPMPEAYPRLYLRQEADRLRAAELIAAYEAGERGPPRRCPACTEQSPPTFSVCWSCGAAMDDQD